MTNEEECLFPQCSLTSACRGYCRKHYEHHRRRGTFSSLRVHRWGLGKTHEERFWSRVDKTPGLGRDGDCWEWTGTLRGGYPSMSVAGRIKKASHFAFFIVNHHWPNGILRHSCDNPLCVNIAHLKEGTQQDNINDKVLRNRQVKGSRHGNAKLTEAAVKAIRKLVEDGASCASVAPLYGVDKTSIQLIVRRKIWTHI